MRGAAQVGSGVAGCRFCAVVRGDPSAEVVFEDDVSVAFLDHRPLFPGHILLIPRTHFETLAELAGELVGPFFHNVRMLAGAVESAMAAEGTFVAMNNRVSQSVPHLHVHIVPRRRQDGLKGFFWPRHPYGNSFEMARTADLVRHEVSRIMEKSFSRQPEDG